MKKVALLVLVFLAVIYACNKEPKTAEVDPVKPLSNQTLLGELHNVELRKLLNNRNNLGRVNIVNPLSKMVIPPGSTGNISVTPTISTYSTTAVLEAAKNQLLQNPNFSNLPLTVNPATAAALDPIVSNLGQNSIKESWASSINEPVVLDLVSTRERGMIGEITAVFNNSFASGASLQQNYLTVKNQLAAIRSKYSNTVLLPNEGELYSGILAIAESSNEFWSGEGARYVNSIITYDIAAYKNGSPFALIKDPVRSQTPFMTADCIGYLLGWGKAVMDEYHDHGKLSIGNSNYRIGVGLFGAAAASLLTYVKAGDLRPALITVPIDSILVKIDTITKNPKIPIR
ncbi:hypothetical protein CLV59_107107 [Chitinophaga dinghuensis]|uniref:Uncharacterized protein n=1 Tax=Chitinophaga dinghuensis TaxID=1539050 RepID=A0A327VTH2_9BACT|nr:hypothetical protein [Chitinophaga dinghuensis]RAJ77340.1 hypothetical protein CLV59_107107 [Chitinophaga dinghuensis]